MITMKRAMSLRAPVCASLYYCPKARLTVSIAPLGPEIWNLFPFFILCNINTIVSIYCIPPHAGREHGKGNPHDNLPLLDSPQIMVKK